MKNRVKVNTEVYTTTEGLNVSMDSLVIQAHKYLINVKFTE